jgi:hypothetical protein
LDILILSPGGLRPWQGRLLLTVGAQFEQAEQNLVPLDFKRDLDIVDRLKSLFPTIAFGKCTSLKFKNTT